MSKQLPGTLTERLIDPLFAKDAATGERVEDEVLDAVSEAFRLGREGCERAAAATEAILANKMATTAANAKQARDVGFKNLEPAWRQVDRANALANSTIDAIEKNIAGPAAPKDVATMMLHSEVRAHLSKLTHDERNRVVNDAILTGDEIVAAAYLHGPSLLTGAGSAERDMRLSQWRKLHHPVDLDRVERLKKAVALMGKYVAPLARAFVDGLTDATAIRLAEIAERAAEEAIRGVVAHAE